MTLPPEIFPEDNVDPTVKKQNEMSVEDTLGIVNHIRSSTRRRRQASLWRYLVVPPEEDGASRIQSTYGLPSTALTVRRGQGNEWAVWAGEEPPAFPAFEDPEPILSTTPVPVPVPTKQAPQPDEGADIVLNNEAMRLYTMSKDPSFGEGVRTLLLRMSDMLHSEAAKLEVARIRRAQDSQR